MKNGRCCNLCCRPPNPRTTLSGSPPLVERHAILHQYRDSLARFSQSAWTMADRVFPLSPLVAHRPGESHFGGLAARAGCHRPDRVVALVYRWLQCAGHKTASGGGNLPTHEPCDHALGRSRGGWGTKLHLVTDGAGSPLAVRLSAGQAGEALSAEPALDAVCIHRPRGR